MGFLGHGSFLELNVDSGVQLWIFQRPVIQVIRGIVIRIQNTWATWMEGII